MKFSGFNNAYGAMRQIGKQPWMVAGLGAGLLAAPFFATDDDRGYLKAASVTTPLLLGASLAGSHLLQGYQADKGKIHALVNANIFAPTPVNPPPGAVIDTATAFMSQQVAGELYAHKTKTPFDFERHQKQVNSLFEELSGVEGKETLLSNAFQNARLNAMTPTEANAERVHKVLPLLSVEEISKKLKDERWMQDEKFLKIFNANLIQADKLWDSGANTLANASSKVWLDELALSEGNKSWNRLMDQRPEVAGQLEGNLTQWDKVHAVSTEDGKLLSLKFFKEGMEDPFEINLIDGKTGKVRLGKNYATVGVGRYIYDQNGAMPGDVFLAHHIDQIHKEAGRAKMELDKQRAFYFGDTDPLDEFSQTQAKLGDVGMSDLAIQLKSQSAIPTSMDLFKNAKGDMVGFDSHEFSPSDHVALIEHLFEKGMIKASGEGSFSAGVMDMASVELLHVGGIFDPAKQMSEFRSHAKGYHLTSTKDFTSINESLAPFVHTNAYEKFYGERFVPEAGVRVGAVSAEAKTLLGDLPENLADLDRAEVGQGFMRHLMNTQKVEEIQARAVWDKMRRHIGSQADLDAARSLGHLGEGGFLTKRGLKGLDLEGSTTHYVSQLRMDAASLDHFKTNSFGKNQLIGFTREGKAVTGGGSKNFIDNVEHMGDGRIAVRVREHYGFNTGIKLDVNGVKGLAYAVDDATFDRARGLVNHLTEAVNGDFGKANYLLQDGIDMMAISHYMHDKSDPVTGMLGIASDSLRRIDAIQNTGANANRQLSPRIGVFNDIVEDYLGGMKAHGFSWDNGTLLEDAEHIRSMTKGARRARLKELSEMTSQFMDDVGKTILDHGGRGDALFVAYRRANDFANRTATGKKLAAGTAINFMNYVEHTGLPSIMRAWSTTEVDLPRQTKLTYDMASHLYMRNQHGALNDILSRVEYPQGDPAKSRQLMSHVLEGDFSKPLGNVQGISSAFPNGTREIGKAGIRAGSIFDPSDARFAENYSLDLGAGAKRRYIPVLGHDAFKGHVNQHAFDEYSQSELEKAVLRIHRATGEHQEAAVDNYFQVLREQMYGKGGILRADAVDPLGRAGFIQTAPSSLRMKDGSVNPFEVSISEDLAHGLKDKKLRASLLNGEDVYAAVTRHPVSAMPFVKVKIDKNLKGTNIVGIDESMRQIIHSDDDKDTSWLYFMQRESAGEKEAIAAVKEGSAQHAELTLNRALFGIEDDARRTSKVSVKNLVERLNDPDKGLLARSTNELTILKSRTTGAAIGGFSNSLTRMMLQLEQNPAFRKNQSNKELLSNALWMLRQAPISAQKSGQADLDLTWAMGMTDRLNRNLNERDAKGLHSTLGSLFDQFQEPTPWIEEMRKLDLTPDMADAKTGLIKPLKAFWDKSGEKISEAFVGGMHEDVDKIFRLLTASDKSMSNPKFMPTMDQAFRAVKDHIPEIQGASRGVARGAQESAGVLGEINQRLSNAAGIAKEKFNDARSIVHGNINLKGAALALGAGLGLAAVAGVMTSSPSFGKRPSSNRVRPETVAGAQDHIPDEPITGSGSPSQIPRIAHVATEPRGAFVAPINQQSSIDVQLKAGDRQDAVEQAKMLARMSGNGNSNITVVNRDRTNLKSLRFQSQMRAQREKS